MERISEEIGPSVILKKLLFGATKSSDFNEKIVLNNKRMHFFFIFLEFYLDLNVCLCGCN